MPVSLKISFLKLIDKTIGRGAVYCAPRPAAAVLPARVERALVIRPGGIGDAALLVPALHVLRNYLPGCSIDVLAEKRNSAVFTLTSAVQTIFCYDVSRELLIAMRNSYDVVIDTEQSHQLAAVAARLTGSPVLIGYGTNQRKKLYTHPVAYSHDECEVNSFLHLLKPLLGDRKWTTSLPFLAVPEPAKNKSRILLMPLASSKKITLFPGSSIPERKWGSERFQGIARAIHERGYSIVIVGGKDDTRVGDEIIGKLPNALNLAGTLSLSETAAVLSDSELLITGDSGIMHIGYGLGKKIVALFGPGREKKWAPRGNNCIVLNKNLDCSPCTTFGDTPKCKKNAACMRAISVDEVLEASLKLLSST